MKLTVQKDHSLLLAVKVVPGASRSRIVGLHGESLKIAVAAPPEAGKANKAVCQLLADALGLPARAVTLHSGGANPFKTLRITGATVEQVRSRLGL